MATATRSVLRWTLHWPESATATRSRGPDLRAADWMRPDSRAVDLETPDLRFLESLIPLLESIEEI